jgi:hypothetical protein
MSRKLQPGGVGPPRYGAGRAPQLGPAPAEMFSTNTNITNATALDPQPHGAARWPPLCGGTATPMATGLTAHYAPTRRTSNIRRMEAKFWASADAGLKEPTGRPGRFDQQGSPHDNA